MNLRAESSADMCTIAQRIPACRIVSGGLAAIAGRTRRVADVPQRFAPFGLSRYSTGRHWQPWPVAWGWGARCQFKLPDSSVCSSPGATLPR